MADLGINTAGRGEYSPEELKATGARWLRMVLYPDYDARMWIASCHDLGMKILLVVGSETIGQDPRSWRARLQPAWDHYKDWADAWQIGNEPDQESPSSWTMSHDEFNQLIRLARSIMPAATLIGGGLVSGQPSWLDGIDLTVLNGIGVHPYAKEPNTFPLYDMLRGYTSYNKPIWCTEFHARTRGMAAYLGSISLVSKAMAFCYSDGMVPGFGIKEDPAAYQDFIHATGGTGVIAPQRPVAPILSTYYLGPGLKDLCARKGYVPLSDERYFNDQASAVLVQTPDGPRILYWWQTQKKAYLGPVEEVA